MGVLMLHNPVSLDLTSFPSVGGPSQPAVEQCTSLKHKRPLNSDFIFFTVKLCKILGIHRPV